MNSYDVSWLDEYFNDKESIGYKLLYKYYPRLFPEDHLIDSITFAKDEVESSFNAFHFSFNEIIHNCIFNDEMQQYVPGAWFRDYMTFLLYYRESKSIFEKSFMLSLLGSYNLANSNLRNAFECFIKGAVHNKMYLQVSRGNKAIPLKNSNSNKALVQKFTRINKKADAILTKVNVVHDFTEEIEKFENKKCRLTFSDFLHIAFEQELVNKKYSSLRKYIKLPRINENVHENYDKTDISRQFKYDAYEDESEDFIDDTKWILESLKNYLDIFPRLIDICLQITLNLYSDKLSKTVKSDISDTLENYSNIETILPSSYPILLRITEDSLSIFITPEERSDSGLSSDLP